MRYLSLLFVAFLASCGGSQAPETSLWQAPGPLATAPESATCLEFASGAPRELVFGLSRTVVAAGGPSPVPESEWADFRPGFTNRRIAPRTALSQNECLWRSPGAAADCEGAACATVVESGGYTWVETSRIGSITCVPAESACDPTAVSAGQLAVIPTTKCQAMTFSGDVWLLDGPDGLVALMTATEASAVDAGVALPEGWSLRQHSLAEPLTLTPRSQGGECAYVVLRDHAVQSYHVVQYPGETFVW